jgi:DNA recombination protein RmuC
MFSEVLVVLLLLTLILNVILLVRSGNRGEMESRLRDELARIDRRQADDNRALREELSSNVQRFTAQTDQRAEFLRTSVTQQMEGIRGTVEERLKQIQTGNAAALEQMRQTVDEKLQATLETRLGESFRLVSERLEQVHKGLGEMQHLATGVGDLKRVLSNVTTRGAWGEVQLENLLTQMLAPEQFERNVATTGTRERVEFAIKLPGQDSEPVWLPIDAKFPMESYQRLAAAAERGDAEAVEVASRQLENAVRANARDFSAKYLAPPRTTDFGILFLATEGLYAEVLRRPGLAESLQRDYRVVLSGPTTFAALLNSLQMGFKTLAIQERSGEVWRLLGDVKAQFGKYSQVLADIRKRLDQAVETVDAATVRTRAIERQLRNVEAAEDEEDSGQLPLIASQSD